MNATHAPVAVRSWALLAAAGVAAALLAGASWPVPTAGDELSDGLDRHLRQVEPAAVVADAAAAETLARRYVGPLSPEIRQRIGDRVRDEQRRGLVEPGRTAFVLRRLALYEAELQRGATAAVPG